MSEIIMSEFPVAEVSERPSILVENRRAGRMPVSANLLPLLRDPARRGMPSDDTMGARQTEDELGAARGIMLAVMLCAPVWLGLGAFIYAVYW